jgi:apolipoprotein N-acyltransferase
LSGVLFTLLYPPFDLSTLAWIAATPLILALDGVAPLAGLALGWLAGTIGVLGVTGFWIFHAARDYFQLSLPAAAAFTVGTTQIFVSVYFALFGLTVALIGRPRFRFILIPTLFVASEYARAHCLSGNPWELLGHSQENLWLIQLCDLTGVYGLSFLLAFAATALAEVRHTRLPLVVTVLMVLGVYAYGEWRLARLAATADEKIQVGMVQANLPNAQRGRPESFSTHLERYLDLTRQVSAPPPTLIVWPESAVGFFPAENPVLTDRIVNALRAGRNALLTGAPRAGGRPGVAAIYNSAYLLTGDGVAAVYDKRVLLPFVERMPLRPEDGPYLAGTEPTIFSVAGTRFGALICYEAIYPELSRELVRHGAQFLVNISNDSWFEAGAGPEQHYALARFRAVENHVSLVRVTNSGVSGVIDPAGREIVRLPSRATAAESVAVPITPGGSFYSDHGDVFAGFCIGFSCVALGLRLLGRLPQ